MNGSSRPSYLPTGFAIDLILPPDAASLVQAQALTTPAAAGSGAPADATALSRLLETCLLVEDNLFIAVDVEDSLRKLGAGTVHVARSVPEAAAIVANTPISFALLDVNLGSETSMPVAEALLEARIPFAFGTGYGDTLSVAPHLSHVSIISKPYQQSAMIAALTALLMDA